MTDKMYFPIELHNRDYDLDGPNGNAFFVMAEITSIIKQCGEAIDMPADRIKKYVDEYIEEAKLGDYEHLLKVSNEYVEFNWIRNGKDTH